MKILIVMKRFGAYKDMVMEGFGRQIRLFEPLAKKHNLHFFCPDYIKKEKKAVEKNGIRFLIEPLSLFHLPKFISSFAELIKKEKYDIIVGTSDPLIGILCNYYAKKFSIPFVYDLMDNFEAYQSYKIPLVKFYDRKAVREANIVLTISETLKKYISHFRKKPIEVIWNGIESGMFKPIDKIKARRKLKLPLRAYIIVYIGNLEKFNGGNALIKAFNEVRIPCPNTYLFLVGRVGKSIDMSQKNIISRKFLKRSDIVLGINAADVAVIPSPKNNFTEYCFPYKLPEYMACNVPIVATAIGDVQLLLKKYKGSLCKPGDYEDLAEKIILRLKENRRVSYKNDIKELRWEALAQKLDNILSRLG